MKTKKTTRKNPMAAVVTERSRSVAEPQAVYGVREKKETEKPVFRSTKEALDKLKNIPVEVKKEILAMPKDVPDHYILIRKNRNKNFEFWTGESERSLFLLAEEKGWDYYYILNLQEHFTNPRKTKLTIVTPNYGGSALRTLLEMRYGQEYFDKYGEVE